MRIAETDDDNRLIGGRDGPGDERVRGVHQGHPLEVDIRLGELRTYVMDIIRHPAQNRLHHVVGAVESCRVVAMDFLNPFQVDHRHDTDFYIRVQAGIDLANLYRAVQAFIEQDIGRLRQVLPMLYPKHWLQY